MAGWNLKSGNIKKYDLEEAEIWALFNYVFSDSCKKRNTYKYGLIKSLLDIALDGQPVENGIFFDYNQLFSHFTENYWNLVIRHKLRQMRPDGKSSYSKIELILLEAAADFPGDSTHFKFNMICSAEKESLFQRVTAACKKYVIGALYEDFDGIIYDFNLDSDGLILNKCIHDFILKYRPEIEKLNYYSWAKFLESINENDSIVRILNKLELSTPERNNLSIYRKIVLDELKETSCFYCGKRLNKKVHMDHIIPWSFVKDDKIWNLVPACSTCNEKKRDKLPPLDFIIKIEKRNSNIKNYNNDVIQKDFNMYSPNMMIEMWNYAKRSGLKEYMP